MFFARDDVIRTLLEDNACHEGNNRKETPLHVAIKFRNVKHVELLIVYGADPTLKNEVVNGLSLVEILEWNRSHQLSA